MKGYKDTTKTQYSMGGLTYAKGGKVDAKQDKALVKTAVHKHEAALHPGKPLTKLRKGGPACGPKGAAKSAQVMKRFMGGDVEVPDRMYRGETERAGETKLREQLRRQADRRKGVPVAPKEPLIDANRRASKERSSRPFK